jgi:arylsulfatase A-like enzyme
VQGDRRPVAGLLTDLKRRGLLDETLVIWGGEFGRMPSARTARAATTTPTASSSGWPAAACKGGAATARPTRSATGRRRPVSVNDLHATILHLLGIDHERLTYTHNGRAFRLTDVAGEVLHKILV